ncbi:MAG: FAD-dependent monooxygenase [Chloroflexota bacterium]|nr:FAD-dependent monooxygenase [Chloroflexota bacterium]
MNIHILGGGPAGLYAALLLKKSHPGSPIRLTERNPRDATYGWGVVFSDRTLSGLHEADVRTSTQITDSFVLWEAIDVHFRDALVRCDGHAFAGIGRKKLLNILQARCVELGVDLCFETEVPAPEELRAGCDLLIAADGVNSRTRAAYADTFNPATREGRARFVWYGTDKPFDAFTFIFRDTEYGLFTVHSYPFDATTSTFIVECHEETWRNAGLDQMDEAASMTFCQSLFADHLGQHRLLSNRSLWLSFTTLTCRRWVHENVVLLGDAAHTAHFSIGSGTKLALEDSIALAQAFEQHDDMRSALRTYEQARRPRVEATQRAAAESQRYFENVRRYRHYEPRQFAFHLLTRSGRITWDNLRSRDPYFVAGVERWFQASARQDEPEAPLLVTPPPMFAPLQMRGLALSNRVVMSPIASSGAQDGLPNRGHAAQLERLAFGGAGLVLTEPVAVSAQGRVTPDDAGIYTDEQAQRWRQIVANIHVESSAVLGITLFHAGRRGSTRPRAGGLDRPLREGYWPLFAPSAIPYGHGNQAPSAMTCDDLSQVQEQYVNAATFAAAVGFDLLQLDMAHGGLLASFLSPLTNQRDDDYGGDLRHRLRYPLQILDAVRSVWPPESPLLVTVPATDWQRGGLGLPDAVEIACCLKQHGCDLVTVHAGQTTPDAQPRYDFETLAGYADIIRNEAGIPTMSTAYMTTSNQANTLLAGGRCDLVLYSPQMAF